MPLPLDGINRWNVSAKFSRVSWQKDAKGEPYSALEYNLDLRGGVTREALQHYLARFDEELKNFDIYASGPAPDTGNDVAELDPLASENSIGQRISSPTVAM